ncbi:MAG: hypothetical protein MPL62_01565 [Alphaproteobacteria bacterium]|nr:hypothetical protein [Alphaproteobacteria bacterium]
MPAGAARKKIKLSLSLIKGQLTDNHGGVVVPVPVSLIKGQLTENRGRVAVSLGTALVPVGG